MTRADSKHSFFASFMFRPILKPLLVVLASSLSIQGLTARSEAPPRPFKSKTFVVPQQDGQDDAVAIRNALANFSSDSTILFEKSKTYSILTPLNFGSLENVDIIIEGNITLPDNISQVQGSKFRRPLVHVL